MYADRSDVLLCVTAFVMFTLNREQVLRRELAEIKSQQCSQLCIRVTQAHFGSVCARGKTA